MAERQSARLCGNTGAQSVTLQGLNDIKHWRDRAAQMRVLSGEMKDFDAQTLMLKLANDYDKLADRAEDRAARNVPGRPSPTPKAR